MTTISNMTIHERLSSPGEPSASHGTRQQQRQTRQVENASTTTRGISSHILIAIISFMTALILSERALVGATNAHESPLVQRPDPSGRPQLMVAIYCPSSTQAAGTSGSGGPAIKGQQLYQNQYLDVESRKWRSDRQNPEAVCTQDKQAILAYCKRVYPGRDIRNIVESSRPYKLDNWCRAGATGSKRRACRSRLTVRPYRCLEGTFQSDALLVPERCVFDHVHNKSVCESSDSWNRSASEICRSKSMRLQSFGMLQPCGLDVFSGVEFVCCPSGILSASPTTSTTTSTTSTTTEASIAQAAAAAAAMEANEVKTSHEEQASKESKWISDFELSAASADSNSRDQGEHDDGGGGGGGGDDDDDDDDEYDEAVGEDQEDGYDDDSSSWNGANVGGAEKSGANPTTSTTTTSTTTTTTTTTTTERPIQRYFSHFDLAHEHEEFKKAERAVQADYEDKIKHVMREWAQMEKRADEMKTKDSQAAEEFKRKMTHQFQKTVEALEKESAAERHQLAAMHAERAMTVINRRKRVAMDCLKQAIDRVPTRTRQVERCIVRLLKALEKDRTHTLRQYRNLLNLNTREALKERDIIVDHLDTLDKAARQSIAMLDRSPVLVSKLKGKIVSLWHKLRGVPLEEPIVRESEERALSRLEEEVGQRKIERERKRLAEQEQFSTHGQVGEQSQAVIGTADQASSSSPAPISATPSTSSTTTSTSATTTTTSKPVAESTEEATAKLIEQPLVQVVSHASESSEAAAAATNNKDARAHYQATGPVGFAHLRMEAPYHELSYSVRHEPLQGHMKFGYTTLLASSFAAVVLLAFMGAKYYGSNSTRAYRRQGFAEVGRSCPEEKSVTHMQFNGYENPAYKFFEAEA